MFQRLVRFFNRKDSVTSFDQTIHIDRQDSDVSEEKLASDILAYIYVRGNAEITFGSSTINAIAAEFYYERIPKDQIFGDLQSAFLAAKKSNSNTNFFIMEAYVSDTKKGWRTRLDENLQDVFSYNNRAETSKDYQKEFFFDISTIHLPTKRENKQFNQRHADKVKQMNYSVEDDSDKENREDENNLNVPSNKK